jgi:hypothetical protein
VSMLVVVVVVVMAAAAAALAVVAAAVFLIERNQEQRLCPTLCPDCSRGGRPSVRAARRDLILLFDFFYLVGVTPSCLFC